MTVRITPDVRAEIESAASREEISLAAIMRQALRDWAIRRQVERAQVESRQ